MFTRTRQCQLTVLKDFHPFYLSLVFLGGTIMVGSHYARSEAVD